MGKKRKTQEVVVKRKALTEFSCPYCKMANSVRVRMKKDGNRQQATCFCSQCEK